MKYLLLPWLLFLAASLSAQKDGTSKYWIFLKDKGLSSKVFFPDSYFHPAALKRRQKNGLPTFDYADLPVENNYRTGVSKHCTKLIGESRWFNTLFVWATPDEVAIIKKLPFVSEVKPVAKHVQKQQQTAQRPNPNTKDEHLSKLTPEELAYLKYQTQRFQADTFQTRNLKGKGVRIAVFDAGFPAVDKHEAFRHLKISETKDFHSGQSNVFGFNDHGTCALSCIGGVMDSVHNIGMATAAEYMLARTENAKKEVDNEQEYWIMAAEWADQHGADIISSSLGYTHSHYFQEEMDGQTAPISKAAAIAAQKGILVFNAAGNEGTDRWRTIGAPADAKDVFAIAATDPKTDIADVYSSVGPSADGRLKPELSAPGTCIVANGFNWLYKKPCADCFQLTQGTSFATPLTAGFTACALEAFPELSAKDMREKLLRSGHLYPYYDYSNGYGVPQASKLFGENHTPISPTFNVQNQGDSVSIQLLLPEPQSYKSKNFYLSFFSGSGKLIHYCVVRADTKGLIVLSKANPDMLFSEKTNRIQIPASAGYTVLHFEGYTLQVSF